MSIIIDGIRSIGRRTSSFRGKIMQQEVANMLRQDVGDIVSLTQGASKKQMSFLSVLANSFNRFNYYRAPEMQENSTLVNAIFSSVSKPNEKHLYICRNFADSFENMKDILNWAGNDKKRLNFVIKLNKDLYKMQKPEKTTLIPELLKSEYANEYMARYKEIKPYLELYKNSPDAVANLNKAFAENSFDSKYYAKLLKNSKIKDSFPFTPTSVLNSETYLKLATPENTRLAQKLEMVFSPTKEMLENGSDKDIIEILSSTTKKNHKLRMQVLDVLGFSIQRSEQRVANSVQNENIKLLGKLYKILDEDKNANNFIKKSLPNLDEGIRLDELVEIIENVSTKKLNIFKENAWNIIHKTSGQERLDALNNNITDAFFETASSRVRNRLEIRYGYKKRRTIFEKMYTRIVNGLNILRDAITSDTKVKEVALPKKKTYVEPEITVTNAKDVKKALLREKTISYVKAKLGKKTFASQQESFGKNATQIRMSMLPEIFASISDTRKVDRLVGKRKSSSSNKDALILYSKINGHNKKFVNYMLKKRNVDNSRMFEVKDIIAILDKAEKNITNNKKMNADYRAKDIKEYYNHLFNSKIEQYGKLQRTKPVKK